MTFNGVQIILTIHNVTALETKPGIVFLAGNALVLLCVVPLLSLLAFFIASALFVYGRRWIDERERTAYLGIAIGVLLMLLAYYHLGPVLVANASPIAWFFGRISPQLVEKLRTPGLLSSIGVSYCFLRSAYALLDPKINLWSFTRYYLFFPTFFSGPVMRPDDYLAQTAAFHRSNMASGLARMSLGAIKVVLSLFLQGFIPLTSTAGMVEIIQHPSVVGAWFFAIAVGVWLFLNFSGFTDICIGFGRLCNITVPENFNNPFAACDITDFWRRWHMSLAAWLRTCIYTPIARRLGNHFGQQHVALLVMPPVMTMVVCGLWHGLSFSYLIWGGLHGIALVAHQFWKSTVARHVPDGLKASKAYAFLSWMVTHAFVGLTWVFFFPSPAPSLLHSVLYLTRMFGIANYQVDMALTNWIALFSF